MSKSKNRFYIQIGALALVLASAGYVAAYSPKVFSVEYQNPKAEKTANQTAVVLAQNQPGQTNAAGTNGSTAPTPPPIVVTHIKTPDPVKAIYMTQCTAGVKSLRDNLVSIVQSTELNSIVIDVKDYSGRISFVPSDPKLAPIISPNCRALDMEAFIDSLHKKGIYVIGRITVFQDPYMTALHPELAVRKLSDGGVWKDYKGLSFIDVGARPHWDYIVELSKEAYNIGFDELNYDYIRFPSDGNMKDTFYSLDKGKTKPEALEEFFTYLHDQIKPTGAVMSADLFGMTTTNQDDLNIGQVLERALPHFDFIDPMVYPSHYPPGFHGYSDPNKYPYGVVNFSMTSAVTRAKAMDAGTAQSTVAVAATPAATPAAAPAVSPAAPLATAANSADSYKKLRPWLQDFQYGGHYGVPEIQAQIKATYDAGLDSWLIWSAANTYTVAALVPKPCKLATATPC